ncbi:ROK family protein [Niallia oryzisoli]|uniref:transcriptional repressor XylR n=1 Tax=Niallia oryzisoli TaxID=1737571 RepID=UPI00373547FD
MNIADQALVKKINQELLLNQILSHSPISRAKLSEITGLNKSTVSAQVNTLIEKQLIFEIGQGQSRGGRKPVMLVFNKNAGYSIGLDLGVDYINGILTDLEGNILQDCYHDLNELAPEKALEILFSIIKGFLNQLPDSPYGLTGIGVCVPGLVDNNHIVFTPNSYWSQFELQSLLQQEFNVPIFIENEANAGAYGEKKFGSASNFNNLIYVSISTGIGVGIIINNELYKGINGFSGEMGHMTIDFNGPKCSCGNRGCWELYASEKALFKSLKHRVSYQEITNLVQQNDVDTLSSLQNFGFNLGIGLTSILNTFNTEAVILRNHIIETQPIVLNSIKNTVSSRVYPQLNYQYELIVSSLGKNAPALGASSIVIENFLDIVKV